MRLRNNKNAKEIIENSKYVILEPEKNIGNWDKVFNNSNPIYVEIGCGKGNFVIESAKRNKNINYIGIEMYDTVLMYAINKIDEELDNLRFIRMDARLIDEVFDKEIDLIFLNFSDPWPKKRNAKRRLSHRNFLEKYDRVFRGKKVIYMKTDNTHLFEFSIESLSDYGYKIKNVSLDLVNSGFDENIMTEYEKKFIDEGIKINRLEAYKD